MINYFVLGYQGFEYFNENFDKSKYPNTVTRIIDNGNQKIDGFQNYQLNKNIGCSGGFNLICYIGFQYLGLEKIIIGQEDTIPEEDELQELLDKCNENKIAGLLTPFFELATFAFHRKTFIKVGMFDENCIDGYCEAADDKHRCFLNNIEIEHLGKSHKRNLGMSRLKNKRIYDTITVNRMYIKDKWGKSVSELKEAIEDEQPPYEFKNPFNNKKYDSKFIPITHRMKMIHELKKNELPSQSEIFKFLTAPQSITK